MQLDQNLKQPLLDSGHNDFPLTVSQLKDVFQGYISKEDKLGGNKEEEHKRQLSKLIELGGTKSIISSLKTSLQNGLSDSDKSDMNQRVSRYGENKKKEVKPQSLLNLVLAILEDAIVRVLLLAATVSLIIGIWKDGISKGWYEGVTIYLAVLIITVVTAGNDYMKDKQFRKLMAVRKARFILVIRNGQPHNISTTLLLVGDIIILKQGDHIPADCLVIESDDMQTDESNITGEGAYVKKYPMNDQYSDISNPFLLADSMVVLGKGKAVVVAVGRNTGTGEVEEKLFEDEGEGTPLQQKLEKVADFIKSIGIYVAISTFVALVVNSVVKQLLYKEAVFTMDFIDDLINAVILSITIIVVAVPEGLPLAVTLSLAYSVNQMKNENNLVRRLEAAETMGGANEVCTDKTGTLTQNLMKVVQYYSEGELHSGIETVSLNSQQLIMQCCTVNNTSYLLKEGSKVQRIGNQTECALLDFVNEQIQKVQQPGSDVTNYQQYKQQFKILKTIPFNSDTKKMTVAIEIEPDKKVRIFTKGASEIVIDDSCSVIVKTGGQNQEQQSPLDLSQKENLKEGVLNQMAQKALRTIAFGYKDLTMREFKEMMSVYEQSRGEANQEEEGKQAEVAPKSNQLNDSDESDKNKSKFMDQGLTLVAIFGIRDELRENIKEAVQKCNQAHVTVRMVTGDNLETAIAIAKEAGIIPTGSDSSQSKHNSSRYRCMTGADFRKHFGGLKTETIGGETREVVANVHAFREIIKQLRVLARSTPMDKYILVTGLRNEGNVVAVTGDGTNDAAALKKANVGFAMGIAGTEVAKEAADIILLDDNFGSIITSIKWGRNVYDSIRKFLQFQLTVNFVAMFMALLGGIVLGDSPLTSVQMLWVNLIMDTFAALALATESPKEDIVKGKPYGKTENIINNVMWRNIIFQSLFQIILLTSFLFLAPLILEIPLRGDGEPWTEENGVHFTMFFNLFVFLQVFNEINCRKIGEHEFNVFANFFNNYIFIIIQIFTIIIQIMLVQYGGAPVKCSPLTLQQHALCISVGAFSIIVGVGVKFIPLKMISFIKVDEEPYNAEEKFKRYNYSIRKSRSLYKTNPKLSSGQMNVLQRKSSSKSNGVVKNN